MPPVVQLGGTEIAAVTMAEAVQTVLGLMDRSDPQLVVTPNVDHIVGIERDPEFAAAYARASLRVADGAPLVFLSRLLGTPLPERVTGVDLTEELLAACEDTGRSVFFLGGTSQSLGQALDVIRRDHPALRIAGAASPRVDLDAATADEQAALAELRAAAPDLVLVFLGSPKQEKWVVRRLAELPAAVFVGVGGTVDMISGAVRRAPGWVQRSGLEWLWRLCLEPRRLFPRYVLQDSRFVVIAARELAARWRGGTSRPPGL